MAQHLVPTSTISSGNWTYFVTSLHEDTDDWAGGGSADDATTYDRNTGAFNTMELGITSGTDPESSSGHILRCRTQNSKAGSCFVNVYLMEGTTTIATLTTSPTQSWTTYQHTLTTEEANNIGDYSNLSIKVTTSNPWTPGLKLDVTALELEIPDAPAGDVVLMLGCNF